MHCKKCGHTLDNGAKFCANCGAQQEENSHKTADVRGSLINTASLREYISKVKELEISCYQQGLLCNQFKGTIANYKKKQENKLQEKKEYLKPDPIGDKIGWVIFGAFMVSLIGLIGGLIVGYVIGVLVPTGSGRWNTIGKWLLRGILCGGCGGFILGGILGRMNCTTKKDVNKWNVAIERENKQIDNELAIYNSRLKIIANNLVRAEKVYEETLTIRKKFYAMDIVYKKYQSIVPIAMFDEYLQSGRCYTLEGPDGAYNLYENEKVMKQILTRLDDIIDRLDDIAENQRIFAQEIRASRKQASEIVQSINQSLQSLKESAVADTYYNSITARNTSYLAWTTYFNH